VPPPHPAIRAILVCDLLIRDERTRKVSLIGITEQIDAQRFPWTLHSLFVWATITDGQGDYRIRLDLVRLEDLAASHILDELDVTLHDRNSMGELNFNLSGLVIDRAGRYELALHANDRLVGTKSIDVIQGLGDRA